MMDISQLFESGMHVITRLTKLRLRLRLRLEQGDFVGGAAASTLRTGNMPAGGVRVL